MPATIAADQLVALWADHTGVLTMEREDQQTGQVTVVPASPHDGATARRSTAAVPSGHIDDLQMVTWEDAEWQ